VRRRDFIRIAAGAAAWPRLGASGVQVNTPTRTASGQGSASFTPTGKKRRDPPRGVYLNPMPAKSADSAFRVDGKRALVTGAGRGIGRPAVDFRLPRRALRAQSDS